MVRISPGIIGKSHHYAARWESHCGGRKPEYHLGTQAALKRYLRCMEELIRDTLMWPNPREMFIFGNKKILIQHLDLAAACSTHTLRPRTTCHPQGARANETGEVYKRAYSSYGEQVFLPGDDTYPPRGDDLRERYSLYDTNWFRQAFVSSLRDLDIGEFRCYFVEGELMHIIQTVPNEAGGQDMELVKGMYTTAEWGYVVHALFCELT